MRHSIQLTEWKYVKGYGSLSLGRKFGDKYGNKHIDTLTNIKIDKAKNAPERVVQKAADASGDFTENKIANDIIAVKKGKTKHKIHSQETPSKEICNTGGIYNTDKQFKPSMLGSDLWDFSDAYIVVKGTITLFKTGGENRNINAYNRKLVLKNCAPFTSCISKINNNLINIVGDLDIVMYNLIENNKNCSKCYWGEASDPITDSSCRKRTRFIGDLRTNSLVWTISWKSKEKCFITSLRNSKLFVSIMYKWLNTKK